MKHLFFIIWFSLYPFRGWCRDGDVFIAQTPEGSPMTFMVISEQEKTACVGNEYDPAIDREMKGRIIIPTVANGYKVTRIGKRAFLKCDQVEEIVIPQGITAIGDQAFGSCGELQSMTIPKGVKSIGQSAFAWCEELESVVIPSTVTEFGLWIFLECRKLQSVYSAIQFPSSINPMSFSVNYPPEPDETNDAGDFELYIEATLYVPVGCKEKYQKTEGWNLFKNIVEDKAEIVCGDAFHPMLQEGKLWKMEDGDGWASKPEYDILIEGDTLIGGKIWKKVYSNMEYAHKDADGLIYYAAVREEGERVYAIPKGREEPRVLYDFSLKVGDKVMGTSTGLDGFYCLLEPGEAFAGWVTTMELKNIDVINVCGQELRRFTFDAHDNTLKSMGSSATSVSTIVWVEGVGSEGGLFGTWKKLPNSKTSCYLKGGLIFDADDFHVSDETVNIQGHHGGTGAQYHSFYDLTGRPTHITHSTGSIYISNDGKKVLVNE